MIEAQGIPSSISLRESQAGLARAKTATERTILAPRILDLQATTAGRGALSKLRNMQATEIEKLLDPKIKRTQAETQAAGALASLRGLQSEQIKRILPFADDEMIAKINQFTSTADAANALASLNRAREREFVVDPLTGGTIQVKEQVRALVSAAKSDRAEARAKIAAGDRAEGLKLRRQGIAGDAQARIIKNKTKAAVLSSLNDFNSNSEDNFVWIPNRGMFGGHAKKVRLPQGVTARQAFAAAKKAGITLEQLINQMIEEGLIDGRG